jgi:hypothetical protein
MTPDLFAQLLESSNREIHEMAERLRANLKDHAVIEPLLHDMARNECRMMRVRYDALVKEGFSPEQSLYVVMNGKA